VLPLHHPRSLQCDDTRQAWPIVTLCHRASSVRAAMGSLIKKRRKRMRKKKHKKLLKRTRWQRRQQGR
jgi:Mitochondrial mRNA-processing protein COX24, C-terminal